MKLILTPIAFFFCAALAGAKSNGWEKERRAMDTLIDDLYMIQGSVVPDGAKEDMLVAEIRDLVLESAPLLEYLLTRTRKQLGEHLTGRQITKLQGLIQECPHVLNFMLCNYGIPEDDEYKLTREQRMLDVFLRLHEECPQVLYRVQTLMTKSTI